MIAKAAVLIKKNNVKIKKIVLPELQKGQLLVKIKYSSICHTQIQEISGLRGKDLFLPHCLGHEASGIVVNKHKSVKKVKKKDFVCLTWVFSRGLNAGGTTYCDKKNNKINAGPVNTFSNYAIVSENKIQKINKKSDLKKSVLLGCAAPTAFNCIFNNTSKQKAKKILILGAGGVGLLAVYASKTVNFKEIAVLDVNKKKLILAKKYGATKIINDLNNQSLNNYYDYVLECTGNIMVLQKSIKFVKKFGGTLFIIGNYKHMSKFKIDPWELLLGKKISGSWNKKFDYDASFKKFYSYLNNFSLDKYFGNKIYKLKEINNAIKDLKNGKIIRPLIKM